VIEPIGRWLWDVLRQMGLERAIRAHLALQAWDAIVGEAIARVARPLRFEGGTLWIAVKSSAWAQELNFQKATLLERLNREAEFFSLGAENPPSSRESEKKILGSDCFQEIRFVVRASLGQNGGAGTGGCPHEERESLPVQIELSPAEREALQRSVAVIEEPTLREAIYRAREASMRYQKWRMASGWRRCERCGEWHAESSRLCFLCRQERRKRGR
jgi:predicted nucleic acid-binding Zn ribbon protein